MINKQGSILIAGVDEAGRGPLAGPVYAAAVILNPDLPIEGLTDSKKLTEKQRESLFDIIQARALAFGIAFASVEEIEKINILQATFLAMRRAVEMLKISPELVLVDGNQSPKLTYPTQMIIKGDESEPAISAASILAKVSRDREMLKWHEQFPVYGFAQHKGYATAKHLSAVREHGPCFIHRKTFAPITEMTLGLKTPLQTEDETA
jgi:ribonuclease HII